MPNTTSTYEPLVLVNTADLPEEEWLEYRRRGIGGSDAAAILGVSPFATARDLYYDKLKVVSYEDGESNWVQKKVGHLLEDLVAEIFHVKTGFEIYQVKKMFYHPVYTYMLADIDYFIRLPNGKTAILEIKTTNYKAANTRYTIHGSTMWVFQKGIYRLGLSIPSYRIRHRNATAAASCKINFCGAVRPVFWWCFTF